MGEQKFIFWFNVIVGPLVGGFAAYFIAASVLAEFSWCVVGEEHCVREWVSALSGWAAFVAAVVTLPILWHQVVEARRQTAFIVGDPEPDFLIYRNRRAREIYLTVRNWNRRRVMVGDVTIRNGNDVTVEDLSDKKDASRLSRRAQIRAGESGSFLIQGWTDRNNEPPPERSLKIHLSRNGEPVTDPVTIASRFEFEIKYRVLGQEHEKRLARAITSVIDDD
jgi:hypothetical protein